MAAVLDPVNVSFFGHREEREREREKESELCGIAFYGDPALLQKEVNSSAEPSRLPWKSVLWKNWVQGPRLPRRNTTAAKKVPSGLN